MVAFAGAAALFLLRAPAETADARARREARARQEVAEEELLSIVDDPTHWERPQCTACMREWCAWAPARARGLCMCRTCWSSCRARRSGKCDRNWIEPLPVNLTRTARHDSTPIAWAIMGGGFRALAADMAYARVLADVGLLSHPALAMVSSNSGASWFLAMFSYSHLFFDELAAGNGTGTRALVTKFIHNHRHMTAPLTADELARMGPVRAQLATDFFAAIGKYSWIVPGGVMKLLVGFVRLLLRYDGDWLTIIDEMLRSVDEKLPGTTAARGGGGRVRAWARPQLHFHFGTLADGWLASEHHRHDDAMPEASCLLNAEGGRISEVVFSTPMQWSIRGTERQGESGVVMPQNNASILPAFNARCRDTSERAAVELWPKDDPTVGTIAGVSSAAGALLGSPLMMSNILKSEYVSRMLRMGDNFRWFDWADAVYKLESLVGHLAKAEHCVVRDQPLQATAECLLTSGSLFFARSAPCSERRSDGACTFPSFRLADGGYFDNTAVALTVGSMQRRFGSSASTRLRFLVTAGGECAPDKLRGGITDCIQRQLASLFEGTNGVPPGAPMTTDRFFVFPAPQVFAMPWSNVQRSFGNAPIAFTGKGSVVYVSRVLTETVRNDAFDVDGGQLVDVLVLSAEAPTNFMAGFSEFNPVEVGRLANYAALVEHSTLQNVLAVWHNDVAGELTGREWEHAIKRVTLDAPPPVWPTKEECPAGRMGNECRKGPPR